ncbi:Mitochondrial substrate carrier family protein [Raphanus sativus]|nr:Mitochondrial substrate carrier family protein [Raphanus sativus]
MATEATTTSKFQEPDLRPVSQSPEFKPETAPHDGLRFWQFMIAGSIAGSVEHMAMFPVDTIKTHMQALRPCPLKPVGIRQAFRSIIQKEGPSALYRGIWAMGLGAGPAHAVYFSFYEVSKKFLLSDSTSSNSAAAHAVSGCSRPCRATRCSRRWIW